MKREELIESLVEEGANVAAPGLFKAMSRLLGSAVGILDAHINQIESGIKDETRARSIVIDNIAAAVGDRLAVSDEILALYGPHLLPSRLRKDTNKRKVASVALNYLGVSSGPFQLPKGDLDDDWLNVFERYAEDASSQRLQTLWGKVLAGELTSPRRVSIRALRTLAELSSEEASTFAELVRITFGGHFKVDETAQNPFAPFKYSDLLPLETCGLVQGLSTAGIVFKLDFQDRRETIEEDGYRMVVTGSWCPNLRVLLLSQVGKALTFLVDRRDPLREADRMIEFLQKGDIDYIDLQALSDVGAVSSEKRLWTRPDRAVDEASA